MGRERLLFAFDSSPLGESFSLIPTEERVGTWCGEGVCVCVCEVNHLRHIYYNWTFTAPSLNVGKRGCRDLLRETTWASNLKMLISRDFFYCFFPPMPFFARKKWVPLMCRLQYVCTLHMYKGVYIIFGHGRHSPTCISAVIACKGTICFTFRGEPYAWLRLTWRTFIIIIFRGKRDFRIFLIGSPVFSSSFFVPYTD